MKLVLSLFLIGTSLTLINSEEKINYDHKFKQKQQDTMKTFLDQDKTPAHDHFPRSNNFDVEEILSSLDKYDCFKDSKDQIDTKSFLDLTNCLSSLE